MDSKGEGHKVFQNIERSAIMQLSWELLLGAQEVSKNMTEQKELLYAPMTPSLFEASVESWFLPLGDGVVFQQV